MFDRLDQSPGYYEWYERNGYPLRSYGIGYGLYDRCRNEKSLSFSLGLSWDRYSFANYGLRKNSICHNRHHGRQRGHGHWSKYCNSFFVPICYSRTYWPSYSRANRYYSDYTTPVTNVYEYETNNYYGADNTPVYDYSDNYTQSYDSGYYDSGSDSGYTGFLSTPVPVNTDYYDSVGYETSEESTPATTVPFSSRQCAETAFFNGDYDLARRQYVRAVLAMPEDAELLMLYGYAHFATGDYMVASLSIRRALLADPTLIDTPVDIYRIYGNPADLSAHMDQLDHYLVTDETDADARFLAGFVRHASGQTSEAIVVFSQCMKESPDDFLLVIMRDAAIRARTLQEAAERAYADQVINTDPTVVP